MRAERMAKIVELPTLRETRTPLSLLHPSPKHPGRYRFFFVSVENPHSPEVPVLRKQPGQSPRHWNSADSSPLGQGDLAVPLGALHRDDLSLMVYVALLKADDFAAPEACITGKQHHRFFSPIELPRPIHEPLIVHEIVEIERRRPGLQ